MAIFYYIEQTFQQVRDLNSYSNALITLTTALGSIIIVVYTLKVIYKLVHVLRVYIFSQYCKTDLTKRYGQWVVISGATSGIGLAMAKELANRGHSLIVIGRNKEKLAETKRSLETQANVGEVLTVEIDLSDSSLENFASIRSQIDPDNRDIGILINNAGIYPIKFKRFNSYNMQYSLDLVNVNILGMLHLTKMIMPSMIERGRGLVLNVSSVAGWNVTPYTDVYGATKSFVNSFTRQLQIEYSSHPIDIINLSPGPVITQQLAKLSVRESIVIKNADEYAISALNGVSSRVDFLSGTIMHELLHEFYTFNQWMNVIILSLLKKTRLSPFELSPLPKRREITS